MYALDIHVFLFESCLISLVVQKCPPTQKLSLFQTFIDQKYTRHKLFLTKKNRTEWDDLFSTQNGTERDGTKRERND